MHTQDFPNCCGIMIISDFGWTKVTGGDYGVLGSDNDPWRKSPPTKEQIEEFVKDCLYDFRDYAILMVALNEDQNTELGPIFKKLGFKMVSQGLNSHHDSQIFLYTFCNTEFFSYDDDYENLSEN